MDVVIFMSQKTPLPFFLQYFHYFCRKFVNDEMQLPHSLYLL